jgi:hypothetical protein
MKKKEDMVLALAKEIRMRKKEFENEILETIYFGGGTPSILTKAATVWIYGNMTSLPELSQALFRMQLQYQAQQVLSPAVLIIVQYLFPVMQLFLVVHRAT